MKTRMISLAVGWMIVAAVFALASDAQAGGDPARGKRAFLKCVTCHSVEPNQHKTGPSLAGVWGKKATTAEGFNRYSEALRTSGLVWNDETLDRWLRDPASLVPGTSMKMRGITSAPERQDIIAYLKQLASGTAAAEAPPSESGASQSSGMMGASEPADLSNPSPSQQVVSLHYCRDTYEMTLAEGKTLKLWEFNLRFKTDSSDQGPPRGKPVWLPAGMFGDRSFVVFRSPKEISAFITEKC